VDGKKNLNLRHVIKVAFSFLKPSWALVGSKSAKGPKILTRIFYLQSSVAGIKTCGLYADFKTVKKLQ
jgi:hypothetical protein